MRRSARNQTLPENEAADLLSRKGFDLYKRIHELYEAGWTLRAIGEAFTPPKPRSTIQSWAEKGRKITNEPPTTPISAPKFRTPAVYVPVKPVSPGISPADRTAIQNLAPVAQRFRSGMHPDHPASQANQLLTEICVRLYESHVPISELARTAGVTHRAMAKRIGRA